MFSVPSSMESGNSASYPSGADDEDHHARSQSISSFFTSTTSSTGLPPSPFFDSLPYLDSNPNHELPWSASQLPSWPISNPNPNFPDVISTSLINTSSHEAQPCTYNSSSNPLPALHPPTASPWNSKKRSRASRRASTTVLTTDTSNFRAMVQEFTGIPAPPFASSAFPRARFDLLRSSPFISMSQPYIIPPFGNPSSSSPASTASTYATNCFSEANASTISNYQIPHFGLGNNHEILSNNPNPIPLATTEQISEFNRIADDLTAKKLDKEDVAQASNDQRPPAFDGQQYPNYPIGSKDVEVRSRPGEYGNSNEAGRCKLKYPDPASIQFQADTNSERAPLRGERYD